MTFRCLGHSFTVRATDPALQDLVDHLYAPFAVDAPADAEYRVVEQAGDGTPQIELSAVGRTLQVTDDAHLALAQLVWAIGQQVIASSSDHGLLLLHAAAAELDGRAVLLPAPSGSGKSTLVAGLVDGGMSYLTDDVVALDVERRTILPYPKPISVSHWQWPLLPRLRPLPYAWHRYLGPEGFLSADALGGSVGGASRPRMLVVPRYRAGAPARLVPLARAAALQGLLSQSFNAATIGPPAIRTLSSTLERCSCYELEHGDLSEAVALVGEALGRATGDGGHGTDQRT